VSIGTSPNYQQKASLDYFFLVGLYEVKQNASLNFLYSISVE